VKTTHRSSLQGWLASTLAPLCLALALAATGFAICASAATASPGFGPAGLRVQPPVGAFGAVRVGSCDLVSLEGCAGKTFTLTNTGTEPILFNGFGITGAEPLAFALVSGDPATGCEFLPIVNGYWSLDPGVSCLITVAFGPPSKGRFEDQLILFSDFDVIASVPLQGIGI
jgi:hypothetical protein